MLPCVGPAESACCAHGDRSYIESTRGGYGLDKLNQGQSSDVQDVLMARGSDAVRYGRDSTSNQAVTADQERAKGGITVTDLASDPSGVVEISDRNWA